MYFNPTNLDFSCNKQHERYTNTKNIIKILEVFTVFTKLVSKTHHTPTKRHHILLLLELGFI